MRRLLVLTGALCFVAAFLSDSPAADKDEPKRLTPELLRGSAEDFIKYFDKNKDGYLTRDELPPRLAEMFARLDLNGDGKLDRKEVEEMLRGLRQRFAEGGGPPGASAAPDFNALDRDADGRLTRDEVKGTPLAEHFDEIDTNKDGKIDRREFNAYMKKQAEKKEAK
jgi:Ca2+-binding EF-hand superfamily protein